MTVTCNMLVTYLAVYLLTLGKFPSSVQNSIACRKPWSLVMSNGHWSVLLPPTLYCDMLLVFLLFRRHFFYVFIYSNLTNVSVLDMQWVTGYLFW